MRFGLIANLKRAGARDAIATVVNWVKTNGHELLCSAEELDSICSDTAKSVPRAELARDSDILISMGGDGTFLASARAVGAAGTPVLGINLGSLGFLTQLRPHQL